MGVFGMQWNKLIMVIIIASTAGLFIQDDKILTMSLI